MSAYCTLYLLKERDSWQRQLICFINEDACFAEGGVRESLHTPLRGGGVITQCIKMYDTRELVGWLSMRREQR